MEKLDLTAVDWLHKEGKFEREIKKQNRLDTIIVILIFVIGIGFGCVVWNLADKMNSKTYITANGEEQELKDFNDDKLYMICDVVYHDDDVITVLLPNGYSYDMKNNLEDLPDDFTEVIISADSIDYVNTYKIEGLR
jgi:hypothetical protein